ncbi:MAG: rRNA maturation RNase YbeY [Gemmobacter sp.]|nr:rRNA maturation RNase YbeY [Gemmobacter sp.]
MELLVDTVIEDARWEGFNLSAVAEPAARAALAELGLAPDGFLICVMGCDDARIAELNADFRGKPVPTNVLSWPSDERGPDEPGGIPDLPAPGDADDPEELGDIALAWETCAAEALAQNKTHHDHVTHLVVHAVMHLLGYDHITDEDAAVMEALEVRALARLGVADPY